MKRSVLLIALLIGVIVFTGCKDRKAEPQNTQAPPSPSTAAPPPAAQPSTPPSTSEPSPEPSSSPAASANPVAIVETIMGTFKIELFADKAPKTVQHFIELVRSGFYKDMFFHRVAAGFVIQTGDPTGTGRGGLEQGPPLEIHPDLKHDSPGIVGMARSADAESMTSARSQFYITLAPITVPQLDGKYTIFGKVIEGLDVVLAIGSVEVDSNERPIFSVILHSITMQE